MSGFVVITFLHVAFSPSLIPVTFLHGHGFILTMFLHVAFSPALVPVTCLLHGWICCHHDSTWCCPSPVVGISNVLLFSPGGLPVTCCCSYLEGFRSRVAVLTWRASSHVLLFSPGGLPDTCCCSYLEGFQSRVAVLTWRASSHVLLFSPGGLPVTCCCSYLEGFQSRVAFLTWRASGRVMSRCRCCTPLGLKLSHDFQTLREKKVNYFFNFIIEFLHFQNAKLRFRFEKWKKGTGTNFIVSCSKVSLKIIKNEVEIITL
jgi:hypothetical protein